MWQQWAADPSEGHVLSLGYGVEELEASVDVYLIDWNPSFSIRDLAQVIDPSAEGAIVAPLEPIQMANLNGLKRDYEIMGPGTGIIGSQYMVTAGNRAAVIIVWAMDDIYNDFEAEFEEIVASFDFLP
jgi:hypothetical protein